MMIPTQLYIGPNQENRIMNALRKRRGCRIKVRKGSSPSHRHGEMLLTPAQRTKYQALANGKSMNMTFKHKDLTENMKHKGGFLPLLAAALAPVLGGVAGGLIEREIAGSGIYKKKKGKGMYLNPYKHKGSGMYLNPYKKGKGVYMNPYEWLPAYFRPDR